MRTFTGTLVFEEVLDTISDNTPLGYSLSQILEPLVPVVEDDCNTRLGYTFPLTADAIGRTALSTDLPITQSYISSLRASGKTTVSIRTLHTCISDGGVCQACYQGDRPYNGLAAIGSSVKIPSEYFLQVDHLSLNNSRRCFLKYAPSEYMRLYVYKNSVRVDPVDFNVYQKTLLIPGGSPGDYVVVKYVVQNRVAFMHHLSNCYGGGLLGMRGIKGRYLPLKRKLHTSLMSSGELQSWQSLLNTSTSVPQEMKSYLLSCKDEFEKAILTCALSAIFLENSEI